MRFPAPTKFKGGVTVRWPFPFCRAPQRGSERILMFNPMHAKPEDVQRCLEQKIFPAIDGERNDTAVFALFAAAAMVMKPGLTPDELALAMHAGAQTVSLALTDEDDSPGIH